MFSVMRSAWTTILRRARIRNSIRPSSAQLNSKLKQAIVYITIGTDDTLAEHAQERGYLNHQGASGGGELLQRYLRGLYLLARYDLMAEQTFRVVKMTSQEGLEKLTVRIQKLAQLILTSHCRSL